MEDKNGDMFWRHRPLLGWFYLFGNYTGAMPISVRWIFTIVSRVRCPDCWRKYRRPSDMCNLCYGHKSSISHKKSYDSKASVRRSAGGRKNRTIFGQFLDIVRCPVKFRYYLKLHRALAAFCRVIEGKMTSVGHLKVPGRRTLRYVTTQEKFLKIVRCPGDYQFRLWFANCWNRTASVLLFVTILHMNWVINWNLLDIFIKTFIKNPTLE